MSRTLVTTGENDLFWMRDGEPVFLKYVGMTELSFGDQDEGTAVLTGYLPEALKLRELKRGDTVEVVNRCFGARKEYTAEDVIIRLELLKVVKRIPNPVALRPEEDMRLCLEVIAHCKVTFLFRPEEA